MGRTSTITPDIAAKLLGDQKAGKSRRQMAAEHGLSLGAVNRYFESLGTAGAQTIVQRVEVVETAGTSLWETRGALNANYARTLALVKKLEAGIVEVKGEFTTSTPIATHVAALKEVREHIKTSLAMLQLLVDIDEVRQFQRDVIESIGEADEPTKQRILARLKARRAMGFLS